VKHLKKILLLTVLIAVGRPGYLFAAQPRQVTLQSNGQPVQALLYEPAGHGKHPAIVVIHEWWGLNDWIKQQAQGLADQGYVALAVDLYRGKVATDPETAHELMRGLPQDRGVADLLAGAHYLAQLPDVDPHRIGAVGWCMGGTYAALLAVSDPQLKAVAINYGSLPTDPASLAQIHAAVLGNFGGLDRGITPDDVHAFEQAMRALGKPVDVKIYPDAGHAFENPNNQGGYKAADTQDAQARMRKFFASHL
jgi:carboxymethylenebutenolidase